MHWWTTRFPPMHSNYYSSIGLFTSSGVGTSCPALPCTIFLSESNLPATSRSMTVHFGANFQHVLMYSAAGMSFSIISNHQWQFADSRIPDSFSTCFKDSGTTSTFWQLQLTIISHLQSLCNLQIVVAIIIPNHGGRCVTTFTKKLKSAGWCISNLEKVFFLNLVTLSGGAAIWS